MSEGVEQSPVQNDGVETMTALVNYESESVELQEVEVPEIKDGQALLRVEAVGVCGSDIHQWHGSNSWEVNYPVTLGHEFGGVIEEIDSDDDEFQPGDRVVSETAAVIDEKNPLSRQGKYNLDPTRLGFGYGVDGAMASYVAVPERCLHHVPEGLPMEQAALTEPCSVAYNAVVENGDVKPGNDVLIIGPGQIGLLATTMAAESGASNVVVNGLPQDAERLETAYEMGATDTVEGELGDYVDELGDGLGFDCVIDASGVMATFETAMAAVRPNGHITKVGWGPQDLNATLDPIVGKGVTVQGSFSHNWSVWENVLTMLSTGQIDVEPIIGNVAPLSEWRECFEGMHDREYVKCVLKPGEEQ
ncbi:zinc-binding dehydrogenase [Haloprofundus salilacus]|uniref:zinc-binding dehydrogenase n=1 Tax=Haloprofundus salilacus TaxID=2876190 RepID=UPI001CCFAC00|nr:zinc-binding dehydrogenase [Haloprofundus salilacus]